jgi:hypothetical protein
VSQRPQVLRNALALIALHLDVAIAQGAAGAAEALELARQRRQVEAALGQAALPLPSCRHGFSSPEREHPQSMLIIGALMSIAVKGRFNV